MSVSMPTIDWVRFPTTEEESPVATQGLSTLLRSASAAGFSAVGIDSFTLARPDAPADVAGALATEGLACTDVGVLAVGQTDGLADAARLGSLAEHLGASICVTVLDAEPTEQTVDRLHDCANVLSGHGVRIALEFLPYGPLASLSEAARVCAAVGWDECGLLLDTWHFFNSGAPWDVLAGLSGDQICLVQVNDAPEPLSDDQQYESRFRRVLMGDGRFDLPAFGAALADIGFRGIVSPEVLSAELVQQDPGHVAAELRRALEALVW